MRDVTAATGPDPRRPLGLRERKKMKTRQTIRREAFRLFDERGYASTTTEQIAEAAAVSASTFFRYFPSKESVLLNPGLSIVLLLFPLRCGITL
jgi:AcrR family transcriptional regulator